MLAVPVGATTIHVPADQPTIQAGINGASAGDTVMVRCGTYFEHNLVIARDLVLMSASAEAGCVVIDAQGMWRVVQTEFTQEVTIRGFTFTNGNALTTGGLFGLSTTLWVENCMFVANTGVLQSFGGAGVGLSSSNATFINCVFAGNIGGSVLTIGGSLNLVSCTFYRNVSRPADVVVADGTMALFERCIMSFDERGPAVACEGSPSTVELRCCDVYGNLLGDWVGCITDQAGHSGNFSLDPMFCDPDQGDFTLRSSSACAPEHSPSGCGLIGALPVSCGPDAVESATWGRVKAIYK
jgi:hypothetical protein